jgi:DNA-binding GntR family transcriptional regulator
VSRVTVRRAIRDLQDEGVLETRHGKGTFVAVRRVATCLVQLDGVSERFSIGDGVLRVAPLGVTDIAATAETANALRLAPGTAVQEVRRLVLADKRPLALEVIHFERARYSEVSSLFHVDRFPAEAANSAQGLGAVIRTISVDPASQAEQAALGCGTAELVFRVEKVLSDAGGSPLLRFLLLAPCSRTVLCSVSTAHAGAQSRYSVPQG